MLPMRSLLRTGLVAGTLTAMILLAGALLAPAQVTAQTIPPLPTPVGMADAECRGCHGDKTDVLTLPSGETLPLGVDLVALDASPHSVHNDPSISCTSCHINDTRYRYPHQQDPAQTVYEFHGAVSQNCESCHYPHLPFHENVDAAQYDPPTCADCHGSHNIARVEEMATVMPDNCVRCHTDRSRDWVKDFLEPRPGIGTGAEGYAGSMRCAGCHEDKYFTWTETLHAKIIQNSVTHPDAVVGDFLTDDPDLTFALEDVTYTIGSRIKQLYLTQTVSDTFHILPAQWNVAAAEWVPYHPDDWQDTDWRDECAGCHVTGLDTATGTFKEFGVGCESCHGPGGAHASDPENIKPFAAVDAQVCGACHSRGTAPDGHPFPTTYQPGDTLTDHFTFTVDESALWADGSARLNHQQYTDWQLGSSMQQAPDMSCTTCHNVHEAGPGPSQLKDAEENALCISCHAPQAAIVAHTPFHEAAMNKRSFNCSDCHMPTMATSAVAYDIHNHSLLQPNPQGTIDHGGLETMPNACNNCHARPGEDPAWAAQTIAFAKEQAPPVAGGFFGPGPTPTSPPPPTPMAAAGQAPIVSDQMEIRVWIRWALYAMIGFLGFMVFAWAFYRLRSRGETHA